MDMKINPKNIAIALATQYPKWYKGKLQSVKHTDKIRGDLAIFFITHALNDGYHIVISDGKSSKTFKRTLKNIKGILLFSRYGYKRSPAKRQAYKKAAEIPGVLVIVATEAEKTDLIRSIPIITSPILSGESDIVIPKRDHTLFKSTYPEYQYQSEMEGNKLYNEQLCLQKLLSSNEEDLDHFFGPRAFSTKKSILRLFTTKYTFKTSGFTFDHKYFDPEELSNASFFPVVKALMKKMNVKSVTIPFSYPELQKENELIGDREKFEDKRRIQRLGLLVELMHFLEQVKG
jgi:hypothetical protein